MAVTVNIYYSGENGNARKFAEEMESSGTVAEIRKEGQRAFERTYPDLDFREIFGKNYLTENE